MNYIKRKNWGAAAPRRTPRRLLQVQSRGIVVHYEAVDSSMDTHDKCDDRVRRTQRFHQETRGWSDIAYNWLVCRHGVIYEGRGWGVRSAANGTDEGNDGYHAVCYLDDDQRGTDLTAAAAAAIGVVVRECGAHGFGSEVRPHSSLKPTACPGEELREWIVNQRWKPGRAKQPPASTPAPPKPAPEGRPLPAWYKRVLRIEEGKPFIRGNDVINVQRRLHAPESGDYDFETVVKVRGFQKLKGLTPDGVVGPQTARALG